MNKYIVAMTLISMLFSCIRPHYKQQYVDIPSNWRLDVNDDSTLWNVRFWEQFQDPVLNDLILAALRHNQNVQVAIYRVIEFYANYRVVNANLYPFITGNLAYDRMEISNSVPAPLPPQISRIFNQYTGALNLNWEIDLWGQIQSASEAAFANMLAQVEVRRGVVLSLVTSLANAYITLRQLDMQLEISKLTLKTREVSLKLAKSRFQEGETSELEVVQAEALLEEAILNVIELERDIPQQENLISILIGENPRDIQRGRTLDKFEYPIIIPAGIPSDLLTRRPDIVAAEDQLIATNALVTEARALYFPQITLTGLYGSQSDKLKQFLTHVAQMWQYGVAATQIIFNAYQTYYQVEVAKAQREEALAAYRQTILTAFQEVNDALIACQKNKELVVENQKNVKILEEYVHLATLRYNEGEVDYLNVLDAERTLFEAQLQLATAYANNFIAVVQLYGALGGGWVNDADAIVISD